MSTGEKETSNLGDTVKVSEENNLYKGTEYTEILERMSELSNYERKGMSTLEAMKKVNESKRGYSNGA